MTVDAEGCLWVAIWGGWEVRRYTPGGQLDTVVELPAAQITSCAFGGPDLSTLFVRSAKDGLSARTAAQQPGAGALFRVEVGVEGLPARQFAG